MPNGSSSSKKASFPMHPLLKIVLIFIVFGGVFLCGMAAGVRVLPFAQTRDFRVRGMMGARGPLFDQQASPYQMMYGQAGGVVKPVGMMGYGLLDDRREEGDVVASGTVKIFGAVTKIEGNKITLVDNGAKQQVVLSQSTTVIHSATGPVSLSALKVGQTLTVVGSVGQDQVVTATVIRVQ